MYETPNDYTKNIKPRKDKTLGYLYFCDRQHPLASKNGRVWHHRHVASVSLGRWVEPHEIVHHRDEDRANNDPVNLVVAVKEAHARLHHPPKTLSCAYCKTEFLPKSKGVTHCSAACGKKARRRFQIDERRLRRLVWEKPLTAIAAELGVSDVAVAKRCKKLGIERPGRGYWAKQRTSSS